MSSFLGPLRTRKNMYYIYIIKSMGSHCRFILLSNIWRFFEVLPISMLLYILQLRNLTQYIYSFTQFTYLSVATHLPAHKPSLPVATSAVPPGPTSSFSRPSISCLHGDPQLWTDSSSLYHPPSLPHTFGCRIVRKEAADSKRRRSGKGEDFLF